MKKFKQIILIVLILPFMLMGLASCNLFRTSLDIELIIEKFETLNTNVNIAAFINDDLHVEITEDHINLYNFRETEFEKKDYIRSLLKTSTYSMIGFNRFYNKLTTDLVKPNITKDLSISLEDGLDALKDSLLSLNNQFKIINARTGTSFSPSTNLHDEYIYIRTVDALNKLIDTQLGLSNDVLNLFYSVLDATPSIRITEASTDAFPSLLELDAIYNYIGFLDSFNNLFIQKLKATPLYSPTGFEFDASSASPIFELGDTILSTTSEMFEALSVQKHFARENATVDGVSIRTAYLKTKSRIEYFKNLKPVLDTAIEEFDFENLKENVITLVIGNSEYTKDKLYSYINNEQFDIESQKFIYKPNSNVTLLEQQQFNFVIDAFFNNFNYMFKPALESYLRKIQAEYVPLRKSITVNLNGGVPEYTIPSHYNAGSALTFILPAVTKEHHLFIGWYTTEDFQTKVDKIEITQDDTSEKYYYARFEPIEVELILDKNGGEITGGTSVWAAMYNPNDPSTPKSWTSDDINRLLEDNGIVVTHSDGRKLLGWRGSSTDIFTDTNKLSLSASIITSYKIYAVWEDV